MSARFSGPPRHEQSKLPSQLDLLRDAVREQSLAKEGSQAVHSRSIVSAEDLQEVLAAKEQCISFLVDSLAAAELAAFHATQKAVTTEEQLLAVRNELSSLQLRLTEAEDALKKERMVADEVPSKHLTKQLSMEGHYLEMDFLRTPKNTLSSNSAQYVWDSAIQQLPLAPPPPSLPRRASGMELPSAAAHIMPCSGFSTPPTPHLRTGSFSPIPLSTRMLYSPITQRHSASEASAESGLSRNSVLLRTDSQESLQSLPGQAWERDCSDMQAQCVMKMALEGIRNQADLGKRDQAELRGDGRGGVRASGKEGLSNSPLQEKVAMASNPLFCNDF